ncbi:MAG: carbohydrate ABC transporter substrate-binding protein [Spirochaetales bacterium]|nr:carbohydrate ABC transporter substrate-binding protein [Spirochaetales bacterium]
MPPFIHALARFVCSLTAFALCSLPSCGGGVRGELEIDPRGVPDARGAVRQLADLFGHAHPEATVSLSSGVPLASRLRGGTPPDVFLARAGLSLLHDPLYVDRLKDLAPLAKEEGWLDRLPAAVKKLIADERGVWMAPTGVHRATRLWFAPVNLKRWGVTVPRTWEEFRAAAAKLATRGVVPLTYESGSGALAFFEAMAVAELGPDTWEALWEGRLAPDGPEMAGVWRKAKAVIDAAFPGRSASPAENPVSELAAGRAAFAFLDGEPALPASEAAEPQAGADLDCACAPGTGGVFVLYVDGFALPRAGKNETAAREWLRLCSSRREQDDFNRARGAISARLDSDLSEFDEHSRSAAVDYRKDRLVGSLAHGMTADADFMNDVKPVIESFLAARDISKAIRDFDALLKKHEIVK